MEYLAWTWDAHWKSGSNYHIYHDLITNKWTWLPIDFGDTFGTSFEGKVESYRAIPKKNESGFVSPLAQKLIIETPQINARLRWSRRMSPVTVPSPKSLRERARCSQSRGYIRVSRGVPRTTGV